MSELELKEAQNNMQKLKTLPWEQEENRLILERGKRLYTEVLGDQREELRRALEKFEQVLSKQNPKEIKKLAAEISKFFDNLEKDW